MASAVKLLDRNPYRDISVLDIVRDCNINRNTFYYHFRDMPSLLDEIVRRNIDDILTRYYNDDAPELCLRKALDRASENRRAIMHVYTSADRALFDRCLDSACQYWATAYVSRRLRHSDVSDDDRCFTAYICKSRGYGLLSDWFASGMKKSSESMLRQACLLCLKVPSAPESAQTDYQGMINKNG